MVLENFFSFGKREEIDLNSEKNILVGINGSGKSNFLKAIRLLYEAVAGSDGLEKLFMKDWSGFDTVCNYSKTQADHIKISYEFNREAIRNATNNKGYVFRTNPIYEITIHRAGNSSYYLSEWIYCRSYKDITEEPFTFLQMKSAHGIISTRDEGKIGLQRYNETDDQISFKIQELVLRQIADPDRYYPLYTLKTALEQITVYDYFNTTLSSPIRQLSTYTVEQRLLQNGENLVQILQRMKNHHSLEYEQIEELLKKINPMFKDISFDFIGSKSLLVLREKKLAKSVSVEHISDGTLRYLLLLAMLYNPQRGNLICIDEPEIGLHPDMINTIAKAIDHASQMGTQVVVATHSPLLLNSFELEDVWIFEKNESNETVVNFKTEEDFSEEENFLVGQMWLSGKLGGIRWQ